MTCVGKHYRLFSGEQTAVCTRELGIVSNGGGTKQIEVRWPNGNHSVYLLSQLQEVPAKRYHYDEESGPPFFCPGCDCELGAAEPHYDDCNVPMDVRKEFMDAHNEQARTARYFGLNEPDQPPLSVTQPAVTRV
jgi:hypothetical protein